MGAPLYSDQSMMTFQGESVQGAQQIVQKLSSLPFQSVAHSIVKCDCQPSPSTSGILVFVTGTMVVNGNAAQQLKFAQTFHLIPAAPPLGWSIFNDIFRLDEN